MSDIRTHQLNRLIDTARDELEAFTRRAKPHKLLTDTIRHTIGSVITLREKVQYLEEGIFGGELREGFLPGLQAALDNHEERLTRLEQERTSEPASIPEPAKPRRTTTPTRSKK